MSIGDMVVGGAVVKFMADMSSLDNDIRNLGSRLKVTNGKIGADIGSQIAGGIGKGLMAGSAAVAAGIAAIVKPSIQKAMDAFEDENLFAVSLGDMEKQARDWSKSMSEAMGGINDYNVRKTVGVLNTMLTSMGQSKEEALKMSEGLTQLSYDMSSFYNIGVDEAMEKIRSGITGETEPLKALGINLLDSEVKAYAVRTGIIKQTEARKKNGEVIKDQFGAVKMLTEEMTEQQKVQARYGLLLERTTKAQGDWSRSLKNGSLSVQFKNTQEQLDKMAIEFGTTMLPLVQDFVTNILQPLMEKLKSFSAWWQSLSEEHRKGIMETVIKVIGLTAAIGGLISVGAKIISLVSAFKTVFTAIKGVQTGLSILPLLTNPVGLAIAGIGIAAFVIIKYWKPISNFFKNLWNGIKNIFKSHWDKILAIVFPFLGLPLLVIKNWDKIKAGLGSIFSNVKEKAKGFISTVANDFKNASWGERLVYTLNPFTYLLEKKFGLITKLKEGWKSFADTVSNLAEKVGSPFSWLKKLIEALANKWAEFKSNFSLPEIKLPSFLGGGGSSAKATSSSGNNSGTGNTTVVLNQSNNISNNYDYDKFNNRTMQAVKRLNAAIG